MNIAVVGGFQCSKKVAFLACEVGSLIAKQGWTLVCGGSTGVMEAACRGAQEAGGTTVGILPGSNGAEANRYVDVAIPTGLGYARNILVVRAAAAVIAIDGKYGTLSEVAFALNEGKPVVGLGTWDIPGVKKAVSPEAAIRALQTFTQKIQR